MIERPSVVSSDTGGWSVSLERVSFSYGSVPVLCEVSLKIPKSDFAWIVGPNGGGKTTLLKLMIGLLKPGSGKIRLFDQKPQKGRVSVGYMPQKASLDPLFPVDVLDVALMGRTGNLWPLGRFPRSDRDIALNALEEVGLVDLRQRRFADLSGGQQRRLLIARALASQPEMLLLDEPTANLDLRVEEELYELLQKLNRRLTIVMVSHDPAFVSQFVKSVVCVNRHVHVHPTAEVDSHTMSELYGRPIRMVRHDQSVIGDPSND